MEEQRFIPTELIEALVERFEYFYGEGAITLELAIRLTAVSANIDEQLLLRAMLPGASCRAGVPALEGAAR